MNRKLPIFLITLITVAVSCAVLTVSGSSSAAQATDDFTPCTGYGTPPRGAAGQLGPWANRLMIAYSDDGLTWTRANRILSDQADVPDAIVDDDGVLRVYYVTWCPQEVHNKTVVALSSDGGQTWRYRRVRINGLAPGQPDAVDPDIVRTPDGKWRLYFTSAPPGPGGGPPRTYSALSDDGFTFQLETGYRLSVESRGVLDPSALLIGDTWHLFAGGQVTTPGANWHATSTDGLNFTRQADFSTGNMTMANGLAVEGGYRFYGFRLAANPPPPPPAIPPMAIYSIFTTDGVTWKVDSEARLSPDPSASLEALGVKDPAVARLRNGRYIMIYVTTIPEYLANRSAQTQSSTSNIQSPSFLSLHACNTVTTDAADPRNHQPYLARLEGRTNWSLVPGETPYRSSVPDFIRRGSTTYAYTPGQDPAGCAQPRPPVRLIEQR